MDSRILSIEASGDGRRLDRLVADETGLGRRAARALVDEGRVRVDGRQAAASVVPVEGSLVEIRLPCGPEPDPHATGASPRVLVETAEWIALDKPPGMHSERGLRTPCVADFLEERYGSLAAVGDRAEEAGLVHRLDRDTSGVLIAARTREAYHQLRQALAAGSMAKRYLALVAGRLEGARFVDVPLVRRGGLVAPARPSAAGALEARTHFAPIEQGRNWTLVAATMRTGVTHQVRVHAASARHPLLGDADYGGPVPAWLQRRGQMLHASRAWWNGRLDATAPAPGDFVAALAHLRRRGLD